MTNVSRPISRGGLAAAPTGYKNWNSVDLATTAPSVVTLGRGDYIIVPAGQTALTAGSWADYPCVDAPGLGFDTLEWIWRQTAAIASNTWRCGVPPNQSEPRINHHSHRIAPTPPGAGAVGTPAHPLAII